MSLTIGFMNRNWKSVALWTPKNSVLPMRRTSQSGMGANPLITLTNCLS